MEFTGRRILAGGKIDMDGTPVDYRSFFVGSPTLDPEELTAYELGARFLPHDSLSLDFALYYHDIRRAVTVVDGGRVLGPDAVEQPYVATNDLEVSCYGFEASAKCHPAAWCRFDLAYTLMRVQMHPGGATPHYNEDWYEEDAPKHQAGLLSSFRLSPTVNLHLWIRYVDDIGDVGAYETKPYVTLDASLRWRFAPHAELTVAGRNLLDGSHAEYYPSTLLTTASTEVPRSVYVQLAVEF